MRILIIWAESVNRRSGGSTHFWGLMQGIKSIGWQIKAVVPRYGFSEISPAEDVSFIPLPPRCFFSFSLLQIVTVLCLPYWLIKYKPGAVYIRTCFLAFLMGLICRLGGVPLIGEVDAVVDEEAQMRGQRRLVAPVLKILDKLNYRLVDGLVCVTGGIRDEVIRRGADPDTTVVIHNAAQTDIMLPMGQRQARRQLGLAEGGCIVGFAGTFAPWQGLDLLIQSVRQIVERLSKPVKFILVGDGQCRPELEKMVEQLAVGRFCTFLAPMPLEQTAVFYNACDVLVCPRYDPRTLRYGMSPLKFWDAVSVGIPVIVPQGCELDDVLERLALPGTFALGDRKYLAEAILQVLAETEHYQSRRKDVHQIVSEEYSWNRVAERLSALCSRLSKGT